jgi:pantetheine-phosphate adenylyltransferase/8-oxo-dGTP diphosphatase
MRKAVYAGSFDPITNGHLWMIKEGVRLFDELVVVVGVNPEKQPTFPVEERLSMVRDSVRTYPNIRVESFDRQFLVKYTQSIGAQYILRGIRNQGDYEYERGIHHVNSDLCPEVVTVFLMPPREIAEVSSGLVKALIGPEGWETVVRQYVPGAAYSLLMKKFGSEGMA